jgi:hypothetical protein
LGREDFTGKVATAGRHCDDGGHPVSSGVYFLTLQANGTELHRHVMLLK